MSLEISSEEKNASMTDSSFSSPVAVLMKNVLRVFCFGSEYFFVKLVKKIYVINVMIIIIQKRMMI